MAFEKIVLIIGLLFIVSGGIMLIVAANVLHRYGERKRYLEHQLKVQLEDILYDYTDYLRKIQLKNRSVKILERRYLDEFKVVKNYAGTNNLNER